MEFEEEKARNVEGARGSIAAGRMAETSRHWQTSEIEHGLRRPNICESRGAPNRKSAEGGRAPIGWVKWPEPFMERRAHWKLEWPQVASYVHGAAAQLEDAAKTLRHRSVDELIDGIGSFARAQPAVFFAGAMLAGLALTRFLKSSGPIADDRLRQTDVRGPVMALADNTRTVPNCLLRWSVNSRT